MPHSIIQVMSHNLAMRFHLFGIGSISCRNTAGRSLGQMAMQKEGDSCPRYLSREGCGQVDAMSGLIDCRSEIRLLGSP